MRRLRPSLTPMVDVVFLLLLFFLLSTHLQATRAVDFASAAAGSRTTQNQDIDLIELGADLRVNDQITTAEALFVYLSVNPDRATAIRAEAGVDVQHLIDISEIARRAGRDEITLVKGQGQ